MPNSPVINIELLRQSLINWFQREGKDYPWRQTSDPWAILVSELMLQQTTIATVLGRYDSWMKQFPTPKHLAEVDEQVALRSWEGLGYYRRVRSLQAIARKITEDYMGVFPDTEEAIKKLPGIGPYTSGAVLSFAFNKPAPIVDANVARVISRLDNLGIPIDSAAGQKYLWNRAAQLVSPTNARLFNSALMELGQNICTNGNPNCLLCPIREFCTTSHPESLPIKKKKSPISSIEHHDILYIRNRSILMAKCPENERHAGMYRFPQRNDDETLSTPHIFKQTYSVTRFRVTRYIHYVSTLSTIEKNEEFIPINQIHLYPLASPDRKALHSSALSSIIHHIL